MALTACIFLMAIDNVIQGVVDGFHCEITDIHKIRLLDCGNNFLNEVLIGSCHFSKNTHFLGVCNSHV